MASDSSDPVTTISSVLSSDDHTPAALAPVLSALQELKSDPQQLTEASAKVWIASRNESWRLPLGDAGILSFFHDLIPETSGNRTLQLNCLRILANSCADRDANRKRVIEHPLGLKPAVELVRDAETSPIAIAVLWNICNEYEPAQEATVKAGGVAALFAVLAAADDEDDLSYLVRLLELLLTHEAGREAATPEDLATVVGLFDADDVNAHGFDNTLNLHAILSSLLSVSALQAAAVKQHMPRIIEIFEGSYGLQVDEDSERKDKSLVAYARQQLTEALVSIITTHTDLFLATHPLDSAFFARLTELLRITPGKEDLTALSCVLIGNIARSDDLCAQLLARDIHRPLLRIITDTTATYTATIAALREGMQKLNPETSGAMSVGLLHSAVGVLKNLAIAAPHKRPIAAAGAFSAVRGMLGIDGVGAGQVHYSAVSLARLLVVRTPENAREILDGAQDSILAKELEIYSKSEEPPTRTEIARGIVAVLREIYGSPGAPDLLPQLLARGPAVALCLWDMVRQDKYASVRGEGWFGLALLGRGEEGARMVAEVVELDVVRGLWGAGEERRAERENAKAVVVQMGQFGVGGEEVGALVEEILKGEVRAPEKKEETEEEDKAEEPRVVEVRDAEE